MATRIRQDTTALMRLCLLLACSIQLVDSFTLLPLSRIRAPVPSQLPTSYPKASFSCLYSSNTNQQSALAEAEVIFQKNCDKDGLMTIASLKNLEFISELLEDEDLLEDELDQMWKRAPKVPGDASEERIDVDSFVQIYRDIDELFEDDDEDDDDDDDVATEAVAMTEIEAASQIVEDNVNDGTEEDSDPELTTIFKSIADSDGLLSKEALSKWNEVQSLMEENLLDQDEFNSIWDKMPKTNDQLDLPGFLKFNGALDELFEFDDLDEEDGEDKPESNSASASAERGVVDGADISPTALFSALADSDGLVGMGELKRWGELQDMIAEGELLPLELENFFDEIVKSDKQPNKLNQEGFVALYDKIDALFEEEDQEESSDVEPTPSGTKEKLLATVMSLNQDEERLPCGLESTESEQKYIQELVTTLEAEETNLIRQKQGAIEMSDLVGDWELLYSSSSAMAYNKGLSGLGGSFPNGSFGGLKMKLMASKYMTDVEYTEHINVVPDSASFDVTVNGNWELRSSVSIFTGEPSIQLTVVPDKVTYGPTSTRADHWKSLGPTNMLDVSYLDDDLRIMRGNTSTDSILIFKKTK